MRRNLMAMIGSLAALTCLMGADGGGCFGVPTTNTGTPDMATAQPMCDDTLRNSCAASTPTCWNDIFTPCIPTGTCTAGTQKQVGTNFEAAFCFSGGVKFKTSTSLVNVYSTKIDYFKTDGSLCWSAASTSTSTGDNTLVYKNAAGTTLGTQRTTEGGKKVTIQCQGQAEVVVDSGCAGCNSGGSSGGCPSGTCTAP